MPIQPRAHGISTKYSVGRGTYGTPIVKHWREKANPTLKVGAYCAFADAVTIFLGGEHNTNWISSYPFCSFDPVLRESTPEHPKTKGDVIIGNDVWLGDHATIMSGVTIGDGAVIGAHAVVAKDVAPYSIVVGNPARHIRYRHGVAEIEYLLELKWWDWDEETIEEVAPILMSEDFPALKLFADDRA